MTTPTSPTVASTTTGPPSPPSPTASFYDQSDDSDPDYSTIRPSSKPSRDGVKLLYCKSKVYVHPTPSQKDNIPGYIALLQQRTSGLERVTSGGSSASKGKSRTSEKDGLLLAWVPEGGLSSAARDVYVKVEAADSDAEPKQTHLVPAPPVTTGHGSSTVGGSAFAVPLSEIFSLLVRPPSVGWWFGSIIINSRAGESFPALFFHDSECQSTISQRKKLQRENFDIGSSSGSGMFWGGDEVLRWLKKYVAVERSTQEPSIYLIDPNEADKLSFGGGGKPTPDNVKNVLEGKAKDHPSPSSRGRDAGADPVMKALQSARWNFLEKMAQVTTFTRRTAQAVVENKNLPPQVRRLLQDPQVQIVSEEFDSARLYLARWAMGIAEQSEKERRERLWTARDVRELEDSEVGEFEILDAEAMSLVDRRKVVTMKEWQNFFNAKTGRLEKTVDEVKERIFHGGLSPDDGVRKEAYLFLLGVYEWDSSKQERDAKMNSLRDEYIRLKGAWWERMIDEQGTLEEREWWKEQKMRIEKDVHRTDRHIPLFAGEDIPHPDPDSPFAESGTNVHLEQMKDMLLTYNEYNRDLGYVQGMSDLLAPIYAVEQDDAVAFWGFVKFMERMERNFLRDQSGMRLQLLTLDHLCQFLDPKLYDHLNKLDSTNFFFFFRMLIVWYKREFEFTDILRLWESLWTDYYSSNFHLFIAMAILGKHRDVIMQHLKGFDEVLKYVNELSGTIDLISTLGRAEGLFKRFQRMVEAIDKKSNFPVPTVRQRLPQPPAEWQDTNGRQRPRQASGAAATAGGASASGRDKTVGDHVAEGIGAQKEKVISPELRVLLSREVPKLEKSEVREHGGGVGNPR